MRIHRSPQEFEREDQKGNGRNTAHCIASHTQLLAPKGGAGKPGVPELAKTGIAPSAVIPCRCEACHTSENDALAEAVPGRD